MAADMSIEVGFLVGAVVAYGTSEGLATSVTKNVLLDVSRELGLVRTKRTLLEGVWTLPYFYVRRRHPSKWRRYRGMWPTK